MIKMLIIVCGVYYELLCMIWIWANLNEDFLGNVKSIDGWGIG